VESFRTFNQNFDYRHRDRRVETSVAALRAWYVELDRDLKAALEDLTGAETTSRRIIRGDFDQNYFSPSCDGATRRVSRALLIFYGKVSAYLKASGIRLPPRWRAWIG
jgi:hypothetical protein